MNRAAHWFWIVGEYIYTGGLGDHPAGKYYFETPEELQEFAEKLKLEGYQFINNQ